MSKKLTETEQKRHDKCVNVCETMIKNEQSMSRTLKALKVGRSTFYKWLDFDKANGDYYARIREELIELKFDSIANDYSETPAIDSTTGKIDTGWVQLQRLKIDAKKWELSKLKPKRYGDSTTLKHEGGETPIETVQIFKLPDNKRD